MMILVVCGFAAFFLSVLLSFTLEAVRNIRNDKVSYEKIRSAWRNTAPPVQEEEESEASDKSISRTVWSAK